MRRARAALLAGASFVAFAALGAPGSARAGCTGLNQVFSGPASGPILSTGGAITVSSGGSIAGNPTGVDASVCSVTTLTNSGSINGNVGATGGPGGVAVVVGPGIALAC